MTDIVERLRLFVPHCEDPNDYLEDELLFLEAADEIERQAARIAELEKKKEYLLEIAAYYACDCEGGNCLEFMRGELCGLRAREAVKGAGFKTRDEWIAAAIAGETEIERLRAALRPFVEPCIEHCHETCESEEERMEDCICFKARAALGEKE